MKLAIIGSRVQMDDLSSQLLPFIPPEATELVSGGAEGVDKAAEQAAALLSLPIRVFLPDYDRYGQKAPLVRNAEIIQYADEALAFWDGHSSGTMRTILECLQMGKPVRIVPLSAENPVENKETPAV